MTTINDFNIQSQRFIGNCFNNRHIIEFTKMCGYFEWTTIYKSQDINLYDLYEIAETHFRQKKLILYANNQSSDLNTEPETNWIKIPREKDTNFYNYIATNRDFFIPVYPVPTNIVYKIYVDDCHTCNLPI